MKSTGRSWPEIFGFLYWSFLTAIGATILVAALISGRRGLAEWLFMGADGAFLALVATHAGWRWLASTPMREDGDGYDPGIRPSRPERLMLARGFLPAAPPEGWTQPLSVRGSVSWRFQVDDILVITWADRTPYGPTLEVAMVHTDATTRVDVERASTILQHFQRVAEFIESDNPPPELAAKYPGVRHWFGYSRKMLDAFGKQPVPSRRVTPPDTPLRELVRILLPKKLPPGWSPPVAVDEIADGWAMLVDELAVTAMPVTEGGNLRLMVAIMSGNPEEPVDMCDATEVLRHIRGVGAFRQVQGTEELLGGRSFLAEIDGAEGIALKRRTELN